MEHLLYCCCMLSQHPVAWVSSAGRVQSNTRAYPGGMFASLSQCALACLQVGVGQDSAKEVVIAVQKASLDAKKHLIRVPLNRAFSFPHRADGIACGAKVMLRPAAEGTGEHLS